MAEKAPRGGSRPGRSADWRRWLDPNRWPGATLVYAVAGAVVCFWRLGATGLVSMEGLVVDGARQMLASGDWVVPRVYGELYFYKPALAYWLASVPLRLAEVPSEAMLRLPFAACGFLMGLAVLLLVGRLAGWRGGLFSALASTTGVLFLQKSRMMEFDASLTAGVGLAVAAACFNLAAERQRWGVWLLGYGGLAAGFLTKGVPALMVFGPGVLAAAWAGGRWRRLFGWRHLSAVALFVALTGSYLWAVWESAGPAAFEQPMVEARARGLGQLSQEDLESLPEARRFTADDGLGRGWRRVVTLAVVKPLSIWAGFLPASLLLFFVRRRGAGPRGPDRPVRCAAGFLVAGSVAFLLTPTSETRYFLPLAVPMGILCGLTADRLVGLDSAALRRAVGLSAGAAVLFAAATVALAVRYASPPIAEEQRLAMAVLGVAAVVASFLLLRWRSGYRFVLLLAVAFLCAMTTQYLGVEPYRASKRDLGPQAAELADRLPASGPVWVLGPADEASKHASLFFYLDRPVLAFRPDTGLPPAGAHCLFTARDLGRLEGTPGFTFRETARAEHVWWSYRLGLCSETG